MKDAVLTVVAILGTFIGLPILILWLRDRLTTPSAREMDDFSRRFRERLHHPNLAALEAHIGHALPAALVALYGNDNELDRSDFEIVVEAHPLAKEKAWYIAYYEPADEQTLKDAWPGTEPYLSFANDGCGNDYMIDPRLPDPPVKFHDHETGTFEDVCEALSLFMSLPRRQVEERR